MTIILVRQNMTESSFKEQTMEMEEDPTCCLTKKLYQKMASKFTIFCKILPLTRHYMWHQPNNVLSSRQPCFDSLLQDIKIN